MNTIGWVLILVGLLIIRGVSKGRGIGDIPGDLGALFIAVVSADSAQVREVLSRTSSDVTVTPAVDIPSTGGKKTQADVIALGHALTARGFRVGEGPPPFGPINRVHVPNSWHYRKGETGVPGMALDVNYDKAGSSVESEMLTPLADELVKGGWRVLWKTAGHYDHLHVDAGPPGRVNL